MDDTEYGTHKKSGFVPKDLISYGPLFARPPKPGALLKWLPDYIFSVEPVVYDCR
jgi:hypothetical protein